jgi:hypothetical protein
MSRALPLAGFQVTFLGRFWVTAEGWASSGTLVFESKLNSNRNLLPLNSCMPMTKAARVAVEGLTKKENSHIFCAVGLSQPNPRHSVRGSSRRFIRMRITKAVNIRVINRRDDRLGRRPHCFPLARETQRKPKPRICLTGRPYQKISFSASWISLFEVDVESNEPEPPTADPS